MQEERVPAVRDLEVRATLFGSTIDKLFSALDEMPVGTMLALHTNDP